MVALAALDLIEDAVEEALAAVKGAPDDPGYDVEFREDLDGVFEEDKDINNLAAITMAVRAGLPVTGWKPALRNPGSEVRVERAATQFILAATNILKEYQDGVRPGEQMATAIAAAYMRQARNAFIAGKRALGNLEPLTMQDEMEISRTAMQVGLGSGDPRQGSFGDVLARLIVQQRDYPDDSRDTITAYIEGLMARLTKAGFESAAEEQRVAMQALLTAATSGREAAWAALQAAQDSQAPDLEAWRVKFNAARATEDDVRDRKQTTAIERQQVRLSALVVAIRKRQVTASALLNKRLGILLRKVLAGTILPGAAVAEFRDLLSKESEKAFIAGRSKGKKSRNIPLSPEEQQKVQDEEQEEEDDWPPAAKAAAGLTMGGLLYAMVFDPLNLVDPDVFNFFSKRLDGVAQRFHNLKQLGEKAAFRVGGPSLPGPTPLDQTPFDTMASEWMDKPTPTMDPTPLGSAVIVWWRLGDAKQHCNDCVALADNSPYKSDDLEVMGLAPGSGHTECGAFCHCSLEFDVPQTVCIDGLLIQESTGGTLENVTVMEAVECENHIDITAFTPGALNFGLDGFRQVDEIKYITDDLAFDWDADVAQRIEIGDPGRGVPKKRSWLADVPFPGHHPFIRQADVAGPVLTQKFVLDDGVYIAVFQEDPDTLRFITGFMDEGDLAFENEMTVAALRYMSTKAADAGKALTFDPRLINPGMRQFLADVGATVPTTFGQVGPRAPIGPLGSQRLLEWPGTPIPSAARPTRLPAVSADVPFPILPGFEVVPEQKFVSNGKGTVQDGYFRIEDRKAIKRYWRDIFGVELVDPDDAFSIAQLNDITARMEFFRDIGIAKPSSFTRFVAEDGAKVGYAGRANADGLIGLITEPSLGGTKTQAQSIGDLFAHEYGHHVAYEMEARLGGRGAMSIMENVPIGFTVYGEGNGIVENFAEGFASIFRPGYVQGTVRHDEAIWAGLKEAGLVQKRPLRLPRVNLPPAPTNITDGAGKLIEGWSVLPETLKGSVTLKTLRGPDGARYVFKPAATQEEIAGAAVTRLYGFNAPDMAPMFLDGEWGVIYPYIGGDSLSPVFDALEADLIAESLATAPINSFSRVESRELFGHHLVDWLINNHDGHAGNILRQSDGALIAIDKGRGFTKIGIRSDQTLLGATTGLDAYNGLIPAMLRTQKNADGTEAGLGLMRMFNPEDVQQVLARFDSVSDESFRTLLSGLDPEIVDALVLRKQSLKASVVDMFTRIHSQHVDNARLLPANNPWHDWAKGGSKFEPVSLKVPDDIAKPFELKPKEIRKPKESGFFKSHTPEEVRQAIGSMMFKEERTQVEELIRNTVKVWKKDFATIPQDWQVWHLKGGTFVAPTVATPPGFGMSSPAAYIAKVQGKPYVPKARFDPPAVVGVPGPQPPPNQWHGLGELTTQHPDGSLPKTPWVGDQWLIPRHGPMDTAEVAIKGSDVPLNAPLVPWSGNVPFVEPPMPEGIILDHVQKAAEEKADKAFRVWEDIGTDGGPNYARIWGDKKDSQAAIGAGLFVEKMADGNRYATTSERRLEKLRKHIKSGANTNSDDFWLDWLGHTQKQLDDIDAYEVAKNAKSIRAGVLVIEDDGRMWMMAPRNQFAGYENTWSKGGIDPGETIAQGAVREAREEMGLSVEITGFLGDYANSSGTSMNRYYIGRRTGGGPAFASRKETYAMRLGTPGEIRPMLKRSGKLDSRDTAVLDDFLQHQGLDPVAPTKPRKAEHLGFSIDDVDGSGPGIADEIGYDPETAKAFSHLVREGAPLPDGTGTGNIWEGSFPLPDGTGTATITNKVLAEGGTTATGGAEQLRWWDSFVKTPGLPGLQIEDFTDEVVGSYLAIAHSLTPGSTLIIEELDVINLLSPALNQLGISPNSFDGFVYLDFVEAGPLSKLLENGKIPTKGLPAVTVDTSTAGTLASKLGPVDPVTPITPKGQQESFSSAFGYTDAGYKNALMDVANAGSSSTTSHPNLNIWDNSIKSPNGSVHISHSFSNKIGITKPGPVLIEDLLTVGKGHTPQSNKETLLAFLNGKADSVLNVAESPFDAVHITEELVSTHGLNDLMVAMGAAPPIAGAPNEVWMLDKPALGKLMKGLESDVVPIVTGRVPTASLNHLEQAVADNPMVAHVVPPAVTPPTTIGAITTTPQAVTSWVADPDTAYKAVKVDQEHHIPWAAGPDDSYVSFFLSDDAAFVGDLEISWSVSTTGNINVTKVVNQMSGFSDDRQASYWMGFIRDVDDIMLNPIAGKAEHALLNITEEVWQKLPLNVKIALEDAGALKGMKQNRVISRKNVHDLWASIDQSMDGFVPASITPLAVAPSAVPTPSVVVAPFAEPVVVTQKLSEGMGWDLDAAKHALAGTSDVAEHYASQLDVGGIELFWTKHSNYMTLGYGTFTDEDILASIWNLGDSFLFDASAMPANLKFGLGNAIATEHPKVVDILKQLGAEEGLTGSIYFDKGHIQQFIKHMDADTFPIPGASSQTPVRAPGSTLYDSYKPKSFTNDGLATSYFQSTSPKDASDNFFTYFGSAEVKVNAVALTNINLTTITGVSDLKEPLFEATSAILATMMKSHDPSKGFYLSFDLAEALDPKAFQALIDLGASGVKGSDLLMSTKAAQNIVDDLYKKFGVNVSGPPPTLPASLTITVAANLDVNHLKSFAKIPESVFIAPGITPVASPPNVVKEIWSFPGGTMPVEAGPAGNLLMGGITTQVAQNDYDALGVIWYMSHQPKKKVAILAPPLTQNMSDDLLKVLGELGATTDSSFVFEGLPAKQVYLDLDTMDNFRAHFTKELEAAAVDFNPPAVSPGIVGGQTVPTPQAGVVAPDLLKLEGYDPLKAGDVKAGAKVKLKDYPGIKAQHNPMHIQAYELDNVPIGNADWRRLGNRLELHGVNGAKPGQVLVAQLSTMTDALKTNSKLSHVTFVDNTGWRSANPDIDAFLKKYDPGDNKFSVIQMEKMMDELAEDLVKADNFAKAPPPTSTLQSPFGGVDGYNPKTIVSGAPITSVTHEPDYLAGSYAHKVKKEMWGNANTGTRIEWRRVANRLETFMTIPASPDGKIYRQHVLSHIKRMTDTMVATPKIESFTFINPGTLPDDITNALKSFGATTTNDGRLRIGPKEADAINNALKADAGMPGAVAATIPPAATPPPPVTPSAVPSQPSAPSPPSAAAPWPRKPSHVPDEYAVYHEPSNTWNTPTYSKSMPHVAPSPPVTAPSPPVTAPVPPTPAPSQPPASIVSGPVGDVGVPPKPPWVPDDFDYYFAPTKVWQKNASDFTAQISHFTPPTTAPVPPVTALPSDALTKAKAIDAEGLIPSKMSEWPDFKVSTSEPSATTFTSSVGPGIIEVDHITDDIGVLVTVTDINASTGGFVRLGYVGMIEETAAKGDDWALTFKGFASPSEKSVAGDLLESLGFAYDGDDWLIHGKDLQDAAKVVKEFPGVLAVPATPPAAAVPPGVKDIVADLQKQGLIPAELSQFSTTNAPDFFSGNPAWSWDTDDGFYVAFVFTSDGIGTTNFTQIASAGTASEGHKKAAFIKGVKEVAASFPDGTLIVPHSQQVTGGLGLSEDLLHALGFKFSSKPSQFADQWILDGVALKHAPELVDEMVAVIPTGVAPAVTPTGVPQGDAANKANDLQEAGKVPASLNELLQVEPVQSIYTLMYPMPNGNVNVGYRLMNYNKTVQITTVKVTGAVSPEMRRSGLLAAIGHAAKEHPDYSVRVHANILAGAGSGPAVWMDDMLTELGFKFETNVGVPDWGLSGQALKDAGAVIDEMPTWYGSSPPVPKPDPDAAILVPGQKELNPGTIIHGTIGGQPTTFAGVTSAAAPELKTLTMKWGDDVDDFGMLQIEAIAMSAKGEPTWLINNPLGIEASDVQKFKSFLKALKVDQPGWHIQITSDFFQSPTPGLNAIIKLFKDSGAEKSTSWVGADFLPAVKLDDILAGFEPKFLSQEVKDASLLGKGSNIYDAGSDSEKLLLKGVSKKPHIQGKPGKVQKISLTKTNHGASAKLEFVGGNEWVEPTGPTSWQSAGAIQQWMGMAHLADIAASADKILLIDSSVVAPKMHKQLKLYAQIMEVPMVDDVMSFNSAQAAVLADLIGQNIAPKVGLIPLYTQDSAAHIIAKAVKSKAKGSNTYGSGWDLSMGGKAYGLSKMSSWGGKSKSAKVHLQYQGTVVTPGPVVYNILGGSIAEVDTEGVFWGGLIKAYENITEGTHGFAPSIKQNIDRTTSIKMVAPTKEIGNLLHSLGATGVPGGVGQGGTWEFQLADLRKVKKAAEHGTLPEGTVLSIAPAISTTPAATPTFAAAAPTPSPTAAPTPPPPPTPPTPPAAVAPKPKAPTIPKPDTTIWVAPKQGAPQQAAIHSTVPIPDEKKMSVRYGYDPTEVSQFTATGGSEIDLGLITVNVEPQDAYGLQFLTSNGKSVQAGFARSPTGDTIAFTGLTVESGINPVRAEGAFWSSLQGFADEIGSKANEVNGIMKPNEASKLYITNEMLVSRPELKAQLIDMGAVEFTGTQIAGSDVTVTAVLSGENVSDTVKVGKTSIKGRGFWRAYGDGIFMDRDTAKALATMIDTNTFDEALQTAIVAAAPPPIQTKAFPTGVSEAQPIGYVGLHPDHLYLARTEHISQRGARGVSTWAGGKVEAEWLRTPNILHWYTFKVLDPKATGVEVKASMLRNLRNLTEAQMQTPGMAMDIAGEVLDAIPELQDVLLRWHGRMVGSGEKRFIRMNYQDAQTLFMQFNSELAGIKPKGLIKPAVDPIIWPHPKDLTVKPGKLRGQTAKNVFVDGDGQEWLFKPGHSGQGAATDIAVFQISQHLGMYVPPIHEYSLIVDGKEIRGSLQKMMPGTLPGKRGDDPGKALRAMTPEQQEELLKQAVLDRMVGNDDAHIENFILGGEGEFWGIDKTRSWKGMGTRKDSLNIAGVGQGGGGPNGLPPLINLWWKEVIKDPKMLENVSPKVMGRILRYTDALPEREFRRIVAPVVDYYARMEGRWASKDAFVTAMIDRKNGLKVEFEAHFRRQLTTIQDSGKQLPQEWAEWMQEGGEFKLLATQHEQGRERLDVLLKKFGVTDELDNGRYASRDEFEKAVNVWFASAKGDVKKESMSVLRFSNQYSGGGTAVHDASGAVIPSKGHGAEGIPQGGLRGFEHITDVNEMIVLNIIHNPDFTIPGVESAIESLRQSYNPETGEVLLRRGVSEWKGDATVRYLRDDADAAFYWDKVQTRGFRPVLGTSFGTGPSGYSSGGIQMTMKLEPKQLFMSSIWSRIRFQHPNEREFIVRDLVRDDIIRIDHSSHSWGDVFNLPSRTKEQVKAIWDRVWELDGGPVVGPY